MINKQYFNGHIKEKLIQLNNDLMILYAIIKEIREALIQGSASHFLAGINFYIYCINKNHCYAVLRHKLMLLGIFCKRFLSIWYVSYCSDVYLFIYLGCYDITLLLTYKSKLFNHGKNGRSTLSALNLVKEQTDIICRQIMSCYQSEVQCFIYHKTLGRKK